MNAKSNMRDQMLADQLEDQAADTRAKSIGANTMEVPLADLNVDSNYARELDEAWVETIVSGWDPDLFRNPLVSRRSDGSLWVVDGQHRVEAAKRLGFDWVHAIVIPIDDVEKEAYLFVVHNSGLE